MVRLPRPVSAVILDLDGTLIDTETAYRGAFFAAMAEHGWTFTDADYDAMVGLPSPARRDMLALKLGPAFPVRAFFETYYCCRTALLAGGPVCKPGVAALLATIKQAGLPVAIATSASRVTAAEHLLAAGILPHVDVLVSRDDVMHGKPAPESFILAACRLGVAAASCMAVEDSLPGIAAAVSAGTMAIMVPDRLLPPDDVAQSCVAVLPSLHEVSALLAQSACASMQPNGGNVRSRMRVHLSA